MWKIAACLILVSNAAFISGPFISAEVPADIFEGAPPTGQGPTILPQFTATLEYRVSQPGLPPSSATGKFIYDAATRRSRQDSKMTVAMFGNATQHASSFALNDTMVQYTGGQCMNLTGPTARGGFDAMFGWTKYAKKAGSSSVHGKPCDLWNLTSAKANLSICIAGQEPVAVEMPGESLFFANLTHDVNESDLKLPDLCLHPSPLCGSGQIQKQIIYVAHPQNNYNISGQDVADLRGDAVFLCTDKYMWKLGGYKLFSAFELSIVDQLSQYTNYPPPGGVGFGGDGFHVGRETPLGFGRHGGQCDDDADWFAKIGQWLSLPPAGRCTGYPGSSSLGKDCTWRIERRVNTVEMECLFDQHKFLDVCATSGPPFDDVASILSKALASEDTSRGGCPKVRDAECAAHPACAKLDGDCCPHEDGVMLDCCNQTASFDAFIV